MTFFLKPNETLKKSKDNPRQMILLLRKRHSQNKKEKQPDKIEIKG